LNLVFLDACRDNQFSKGWFKCTGLEGLAPMQAPSGSLIGYATRANHPASDGKGQRNSPYAQYLKQEILKPGISVFEMLTNVRVAVKSATNGEQEPEFYSGLDGKFCFGECGQVIPIINQTIQSATVFQDRLKDGSLGPEMVVIPKGRFQMGDIQGGGYKDEKPVHWVNINYQFAMGKYEVTFAEYDKFAQATGRKKPNDESWGRGNRPVINVSWNDANAYTKWLSKQTGKQYRLPSESEWEYAARAGTKTKYWWGNTASHEYANYGTDKCCSGLAKGKDKWKYTSPVGSFKANQFGLYDTVGNVWEWCADFYQDSYKNAPTDGGVWKKDNKYRVLRGGSWDGDPYGTRAADRNRSVPDGMYFDVGFRVVRTF
jgi:formylglycine-generating enzyme required for sulfatase activity